METWVQARSQVNMESLCLACGGWTDDLSQDGAVLRACALLMGWCRPHPDASMRGLPAVK